jgi:flagellar biosynthesis protein FlhF
MVKKFHAPTTREALRMVRDALGANAIILSNRQVDGGVEIIAVADLDVAALSSQAEPAIVSHRQSTPNPQPAVENPAVTPLTEYLAQREASVIRSARTAPRDKGVPPPASATEGVSERSGSVPATSAPTPTPPAAEQTLATEDLARELRALRHLVEGQLAGFAWGEIAGREPVRAEVMKRLLAAGFSPALSRQLLASLPRDMDVERAMKWLKSVIAHNVITPPEGEDILERGGVYALVGPTGVGKTTTVAKLAARAVLRHGAAKVALVTTDTYRIGAQDQLRIYGRILGTPVFAVQDDNDLELTLSDLSRKHLVLIDTVGMSQRDKRVAEQVALLCGESRGVERLLLLGAPAQGMTLEEVVRAYSGPGLIGCILTKIDEALSFGPCLDVVIRHQLRVHYVTNGQRVPEDLHPANALYLADRAFRLAQAESPYTPMEGDYPVLMAAMDRNGLPVDVTDPGMVGALR